MTLDQIKTLFDDAAGRLPDGDEADGLATAWRDLVASIGRLAATLAVEGNGSVATAPRDVQVETSGTGPDATRLARLYARARVDPGRIGEIDRTYIAKLVTGRPRYDAVARRLGMPWWVVGIIHGLEASFDFGRHLHNGDPLGARTQRHPAGRPTAGAPPFSWEESASDALRETGMAGLDGGDTGAVLDRLERYNGLGYRRRGVASPYLWSFTDHYRGGKYVADGRYDATAVSRQPGAAALLLRLAERGLIGGGEPSAPSSPSAAPAVPSAGPLDGLTIPVFAGDAAGDELGFPGPLALGARGQAARRVQEWCTLHGHATGIDGGFGPATEAALAAFQSTSDQRTTGALDPATWSLLTAPMRAALAPVTTAPGEDIHAVALHVAERHLTAGARELRTGGQGNRGPWVRLYMLGHEGDAWPWCAGFISHVIGQAAATMDRSMPLRRQVGVDALVAEARDDRRFLAEKRLGTPAARRALIRPGALFAIRRTPWDWTHVGLIRTLGDDHFTTVEGNSNAEGSREGVAVVSTTRAYRNSDFIVLG